MDEIKKALRIKLKERLNSLSKEYIAESNSGIFEKLILLPEYSDAESIFCYYSVGREADTKNVISHAYACGKSVFLPLCLSAHRMAAVKYTGDAFLSPNAYGIPEPTSGIAAESIDLAIIPALSFDRQGNRLGYGGGYYDRFLKKHRVLKVGLVRSLMAEESLPAAPHDIPVDILLSESGVWDLRRSPTHL